MASASKKGSKSKRQTVRIGPEYQADIPDMVTEGNTHPAETGYDHNLIWSPENNLEQEKLDNYIKHMREKRKYDIIQALGLLCQANYDVEEAYKFSRHFSPLVDNWSQSDRDTFKSAFIKYGEDFNKIQKEMPNKKIGQLLHYYYSAKECRELSQMLKSESSKYRLEPRPKRN